MEPQTVNGIYQRLRPFARPLVILSAWLTATGFFAIAYILGAKRQPGVEETLDFTSAFALASATAAAVVFLFVGPKRWALELTLPILVLLITSMAATYILFWLFAPLSQNFLELNARDYVQTRAAHVRLALRIVELTIPEGAILGAIVAAIAAVLYSVVRRWPVFLGCLLASVLLVCVPWSLHINAFGRVTDYLVMSRLNGANSLQRAWFLTNELSSAMGAIAGALVGAVIACGTIRKSRHYHAASPPRSDVPI